MVSKEEYMKRLWGRILSPNPSLPAFVTECECKDFEAKLGLGWPDPR